MLDNQPLLWHSFPFTQDGKIMRRLLPLFMGAAGLGIIANAEMLDLTEDKFLYAFETMTGCVIVLIAVCFHAAQVALSDLQRSSN
ncbi:hypothetical protein HJB79_31540 [Rhizobium lentis]|uniref:hypothetical protein n=1 Tax=Rhizobium lentis TaxID=1138194 RepID=UPI001C83F7AA|nr:hypothetical protein [Rhizobium lentis]MBX5143244.1 hypothetical protein [Rhizobium lentis]